MATYISNIGISHTLLAPGPEQMLLTSLVQPLPQRRHSLGRFASVAGGIVLLGPEQSAPGAIGALERCGDTDIFSVCAERLTQPTSTHDVFWLTRQISRSTRAGNTAVVHFESDTELCDRDIALVSARLSRVLLGVADQPAFVIVHGDGFADCLIDLAEAPSWRVGEARLPVWSLPGNSMFPGTPLAICPAHASAMLAVEAFDLLRGRNNLVA